jgi:hypothetical protein
MCDGQMRVRRILIQQAAQVREFSSPLEDLDLVLLHHRYSSTVVAPIFQPLELVENDAHGRFWTDISRYSAHAVIVARHLARNHAHDV